MPPKILGGFFMKKNDIIFIQDQIGYCFKNTDLLHQAFVRRSYSVENGSENNEVLEFIGDKVLDFITVKILLLLMFNDFGHCILSRKFRTRWSEGFL